VKQLGFYLPWPPTMNTYWRHVGRKTLLSAAGREYREEALALLADAYPVAANPRPLIAGRLAVLLECCPPDRRRRDLDNLPKALLDALTHAGVWGDDSQIDDLRLVRRGVQENAGVFVTVLEIEQA